MVMAMSCSTGTTIPFPILGTTRNDKTPFENLRKGARLESALARGIHQHIPNESVVSWGDPIGAHGADVVSVNTQSGQVTLWDTKFRKGQGDRSTDFGPSETFSEEARRTNAVGKATQDIRNSPDLPDDIKRKALQNLDNGTYTTATVAGGLYRRPPTAAQGAARKARRDDYFVDYVNRQAQEPRRAPWTENARP